MARFLRLLSLVRVVAVVTIPGCVSAVTGIAGPQKCIDVVTAGTFALGRSPSSGVMKCSVNLPARDSGKCHTIAAG